MPSSTSFSPPTSHVPAILRDLFAPTLSLAEVAAAHHTSTEALSLWMIRPDIREQLESTDAISSWRTRLIAKSLLPKAIAACADTLDDFHKHRAPSLPTRTAVSQPTPDITPPTSSHPASNIAHPTSPDPLRAAIVRIRTSEAIRRCCALLFQFSRLTETPGPKLDRTSSALPPASPRSAKPAPEQPATPSAHTPLPIPADSAAIDALLHSFLSQTISPSPTPIATAAPNPATSLNHQSPAKHPPAPSLRSTQRPLSLPPPLLPTITPISSLLSAAGALTSVARASSP